MVTLTADDKPCPVLCPTDFNPVSRENVFQYGGMQGSGKLSLSTLNDFRGPYSIWFAGDISQ